MFHIQINDPFLFLSKQYHSLIKNISHHIFNNEKLKGKIVLELNIVNNKKSQQINNKYRHINNPTDVISFSFWDKNLYKTFLLGEIYLNYQKVLSQAKQYKHSIERELGFLFSHGLFHLLGYDHVKKNDAKIMFQKQYEILALVGLGSKNDLINNYVFN